MVCSCIGHLWSMRHGFLVSRFAQSLYRLTSQSYIQYPPLGCFIVNLIRDKCTTLSMIIMHAVH
jgi:hypothetical protein